MITTKDDISSSNTSHDHHMPPRRRHAVVDIDPYNLHNKDASDLLSSTSWASSSPPSSELQNDDDTNRLESSQHPANLQSFDIDVDDQVNRVLVVDDDKVARQVLAKLLEQLGFEVKAVEGGRQALEVLREEGSKYRLLLVDVLMPDMDGLQLLKIFRQAYSEDMPIIMVSSSEDPDTINQCFQSGAEDFLQKPVQLEILKRRVNMCLEDRMRRRKEKAYQEMLKNERINRKKLTLRVKEQEKELEQIKSQMSSAVETPMQVVMKTIADLMEGKYSMENYKGALIAILRSLGSKDLYKPVFSNLLKKGEIDDSTRRWLQTEFMNEDTSKSSNSPTTPSSPEKLSPSSSASSFPSNTTNEKTSTATTTVSLKPLTPHHHHHPLNEQQTSLLHKQVDDIVTKPIPEDIGANTFNAMKYTSDELIQFVVHMFESLGLIDIFQIPPTEIVNLLQVVKNSYKENPYHNFTHAVDVTQFVYHCLLIDKISAMFTPLEKFALIFAGTMHDVCHPGVNNNYLINVKDELALIYNDVSILENHHASQAFYILRKHNICSGLTKDEFREFRRLVINTILSTDMSHHFEILTKFQTRLQTGVTLSKESKEDKLQLMGVILKCSDVSNAVRPFPISEQWANLVLEEFFRQGDSERERGLPISPLMDRRTVDRPKSQLNFIDYIAAPLFNALFTFCPSLKSTVGETLLKNRSLWEERALATTSSHHHPQTPPRTSSYHHHRTGSGMGNNQDSTTTTTAHTDQTIGASSPISSKGTTFSLSEGSFEPKSATTTTTAIPVLMGTLPEHLAKAKGFTILLVDDESQQFAKQVLPSIQALSYTCITTTPSQATTQIKSTKADIIILNYDLDHITELVPKIRLVNPIIPIITISSTPIQTDWCQASFVRPVNIVDLLHSIEHHIEVALDKVEPIDMEVALEQTGGEEEFLYEMLDELITAGKEQIDKIKQSIETHDWATMELNSHSLKGSSAQLACKPLSQSALAVETAAKNQSDTNIQAKVSLIEKRLNDLANFVQKKRQ
ncbi:hypothetical protein C9374_012338 [Naegleria lovaniensis]|uniref:Phosphodiesterase n=1 Tax=Naegleria lovaniensis TaxID=51637 RepID=A0AA88KBQ4_NAELO|nr:uncharacterized protein C9374_012338 [Naegleria lovaniensis]KAG2373235.1 hypothetical protein C9374_012338 [Naegleria lovaniensis]